MTIRTPNRQPLSLQECGDADSVVAFLEANSSDPAIVAEAFNKLLELEGQKAFAGWLTDMHSAGYCQLSIEKWDLGTHAQERPGYQHRIRTHNATVDWKHTVFNFVLEHADAFSDFPNALFFIAAYGQDADKVQSALDGLDRLNAYYQIGLVRERSTNPFAQSVAAEMLQEAMHVSPLPLGLREVSILERDPETPDAVLGVAKMFKEALLIACRRQRRWDHEWDFDPNPSSKLNPNSNWTADRHSIIPLQPISHTESSAQMQ